MLGGLAMGLAGKGIQTSQDLLWADVEGDIGLVNGIVKITQIRVRYHLKVPAGRENDATEVFSSYLAFCPAAQSVIGCIAIEHNLDMKVT
jgi:hypothetical protein